MAKAEKVKFPQVLDLELDGVTRSMLEDITIDLERGAELKAHIGRSETKTKQASGLVGDLDAIKERLREFLAEHGLEGVRYGEIEFGVRYQDGKSSLDTQKLRDLLLTKGGVELSVLNEIFEEATKKGDAFPVVTLRVPGMDD